MSSFPYNAEDREDQVCQLIDARTKAIRADILLGRESTTNEVLMFQHAGDTEDEARAILRSAVANGSGAVGVDNAAAVAHAIFTLAELRAEDDVADMERNRAESRDDNRIHMALADRAAA